MNVEWRLPSPAWPQLQAGEVVPAADLDRLLDRLLETIDRNDDVLADLAAALRGDRE